MMEFNPVQLYYEEHGQGIPVVLLHGFPLDHTIWEPLLPVLKEHARIIIPDMRGHGRSPVTDGAYSMRLMAADTAALLDDLKIEKAIVVGHSMGGYVGLAFAYAYPNRLAGLGLIATQAAADTPEKRQDRLNLADEIGRKGVKHLAENMSARLTTKHELIDPIRSMILKMNPKGAIGALKGMADRPDMTDFLPSITIPSLVLAGSDDVLIPIERPRTMEKMLARAWLVEIPSAGHLPMMEYPQQVAEALDQLIEGVNGYDQM
jgi:3-oxoadipate enol-lactonase